MKESPRSIQTSIWGPYSLQAAGISRILGNGNMVSFFPLCGKMNARRKLPTMDNHNRDMEVVDAAADLSYYQYNHIIEFDYSLFAKVEYLTVNDDTALVAVTYHNETQKPQYLETFMIVSSEPGGRGLKFADFNGILLDAEKYTDIDYKKALWQGEGPMGCSLDKNAHNWKAFIFGGDDFGKYRANWIQWTAPENLAEQYYISFRYCSPFAKATALLETENEQLAVSLPVTDGSYKWTDPVKINITAGQNLTLKKVKYSKQLKLDCLAFSKNPQQPRVIRKNTNPYLSSPECKPESNLAMVKIQNDQQYCFLKSGQLASPQQIGPHKHFYPLLHEDLSQAAQALNQGNNLPYSSIMVPPFRRLGFGYKPVMLKPGKSHREITLLSVGKNAAHRQKELAELYPDAENILKQKKLQICKQNNKLKNPIAKFASRLKAQTLVNIKYPVFLDGRDAKYYTPACRYGSLYLWDMGINGIGLSNIDSCRAGELLNQYFNPPSSQLPFVSWGTMLPCHIFLYWQIFTKTGSIEHLARYFKPALAMYDFFAGHHPLSSLRDKKTGLINNFKMFYNSGGWDDYPAQMFAGLDKQFNTYPVVCTSQTIRSAKILRMAAFMLNKKNETDKLSHDIEKLEQSLYKYHWNPEEKIFSYYDSKNKKILEINNTDANHGLDGYYPLVSGSVAQKQAAQLIKVLMNKKRLFTDFGLTTVDKTAPYFRDDGYWNGYVWAPHNWFFWKALLNYGYPREAEKLAMNLLKGFANAYEQTFNIPECLHHKLGSPAYGPYFTGLTSVMLDMYNAYFGADNITAGWDIYTTKTSNAHKIHIDINAPFFTGKTTVAINLAPEKNYRLMSDDGKTSKIKTNRHGNAYINLNIQKQHTSITVQENQHG